MARNDKQPLRILPEAISRSRVCGVDFVRADPGVRHEIKEISGTLGEADTYEERAALIEYQSPGRFVVSTEAWEVCAECAGGGQILSSVTIRTALAELLNT